MSSRFHQLMSHLLSQQQLLEGGFCNVDKVKEWTAVYYAMIEEIDTLVGIMLDRINTLGIANNTLMVFTSDHGGMLLGAHCLRDKTTFYEESVRVPLFMKLPGVIPADIVVEDPVSQLDIFGTILDYTGARASNKGDGLSLRRFIEGTSYNCLFDNAAVVSEWDFREPTDNIHLSRTSTEFHDSTRKLQTP